MKVTCKFKELRVGCVFTFVSDPTCVFEKNTPTTAIRSKLNYESDCGPGVPVVPETDILAYDFFVEKEQ